jgi:Family of unknown function (DUF6151)
MAHLLQCRCGELAGEVDPTAAVNRCTCYCLSCRAFPRVLGCAERVLDARGGTDIVQTSPQSVRITRGREHLACVRLKPDGTMRWYAGCCETLIGNTVMNYRVSFVGLIHDCLRDPARTLDESFGPSLGGVFTTFAIGEPKPELINRVGATWRIGRMMLKARVSGAYKTTPFYSTDGKPVAEPRVLTAEEWRNAMDGIERLGGRHGAA